MTLNTFAIVEKDTRAVERLLAEETEQVPEGYELVALAEPVRAWPSGTGDLHCHPRGELFFRDGRTLAELKVAKNAEINTARLAANQGGFMHLGKRIATDPLSRGDLDAVAAIVARTGALPAGWPGAWKTMDNTFLELPDAAAWDAFYAAFYATGLSNFAKSEALKARLAAASSPEEVAAITWDEQP